jgi:lipid-binding SYLF domain-containing protein
MALGVVNVAATASARTEEETIRLSGEVLQQFLDLHIKEIPEALLAEAHGVAIIPNVVKIGLVLGGQRGRGVVIVRERDGSWRAPLFVTITGGSVGWQIGAQSTDFMLVFKSQKSVDGLLRGKFTLGADAAVAAGPVGRRAGAATDVELKAEIYSYSRSRGLFAGVSLDGSALQVDDAANASYYGGIGGAPQRVPESALKLVELIAKLTANPAEGAGVIAAPVEASGPTPFGPTPARPVPTGPVLSGPTTRPTSGPDALQEQLARAATAMSPLLDDAWRRHLALPAEVFQQGRRPSPESLQESMNRFSDVANNRQYRALSSRGEFQTTHGLLRAYSESLSATATPKLALPPPPNGLPQ